MGTISLADLGWIPNDSNVCSSDVMTLSFFKSLTWSNVINGFGKGFITKAAKFANDNGTGSIKRFIFNDFKINW